jgi:hypothetical protein
MQKQYFLVFVFFHKISLVYLFIHMCNVYAVLLYSFQSYRSTFSEYVFCPGTPQTTNTNRVSKSYSVFIGWFWERAIKLVLRNYSSVIPDIINWLIFVRHQISSFSLISANDDYWRKLKKKTNKNVGNWKKTIQLLGSCNFQSIYIYWATFGRSCSSLQEVRVPEVNHSSEICNCK